MSDNDDVKYEVWKQKVERKIEQLAGVSADDLPDFNYRDAFEDGRSPAEVAHEALGEAGW